MWRYLSMAIFLSYVCICIGASRIYAQDNGPKISNMQPTSDSVIIAELLNKSGDYLEQSPDKAIPFLEHTLQICVASARTTDIGKALGNLGRYYSLHGDYQKANFYIIQSLSFFRRSTSDKETLLIKSYNNLEGNYIDMCKYDTAALYCYNALKIYDSVSHDIKLQNAIGNTLINLSIIWIRLAQYELAMQYLDQAEVIATETKNSELMAFVLSHKGVTCIEENKLDQAMEYIERGIELAHSSGYKLIEQSLNYNLGEVYLKQNKPEKAMPYFQSSYNNVLAVSAAYDLGDAYYKLNQYEKAISIITRALSYADSIGMKQEMADAHETLSKIYKAQGKYKLALEHEQIYVKLRDAQVDDQKRQAISLLEMQSRTNLKDKEITEKKLLLSRKDNQLKEKNMWIGGISAGALLLCISMISIYRNNRHKQTLQKEKMQRMEQAQQIIELKAMVKGEERERTRIARDLHDGIGSLLATTILNCNALSNEYKNLSASNTFNEVMHLLDEMGGEMRKTANNLMPEILLRYNLSEAIQIFCDQIQKGKGIQISLLAIGTFDFTNHEFTLSIYRIVQELIHNVVKHSQASHAIVQLMQHENILTVTVEDDGVGFEKEGTHSGMGIRNLHARVYGMNGVMNIESVAGKGTTVYIEFDLQTEKNAEV